MRAVPRPVWLVAATLLLAGNPGPAAAQSTWLDRSAGGTFAIESYSAKRHGNPPDAQVWFVTMRAPLWRTVRFVTEIPFVQTTGFESVDPLGAPLAVAAGRRIGNPYFGLELLPRTNPFWAELGVRPAALSEPHGSTAVSGDLARARGLAHPQSIDPGSIDEYAPAILSGALVDLDREEAFVPNQHTLRFALHWTLATGEDPAFVLDLRGAPVFMIPDGGAFGGTDPLLGDPQVDLVYGGTVRVTGRGARFGVGYLKRFTAHGVPTANKVHQLDLVAEVTRFRVCPGFRFQVPMHTNTSSVVDGSLAFTLSTTFGPRRPSVP